jgi:hypothetical protein
MLYLDLLKHVIGLGHPIIVIEYKHVGMRIRCVLRGDGGGRLGRRGVEGVKYEHVAMQIRCVSTWELPLSDTKGGGTEGGGLMLYLELLKHVIGFGHPIIVIQYMLAC